MASCDYDPALGSCVTNRYKYTRKDMEQLAQRCNVPLKNEKNRVKNMDTLCAEIALVISSQSPAAQVASASQPKVASTDSAARVSAMMEEKLAPMDELSRVQAQLRNVHTGVGQIMALADAEGPSAAQREQLQRGQRTVRTLLERRNALMQAIGQGDEFGGGMFERRAQIFKRMAEIEGMLERRPQILEALQRQLAQAGPSEKAHAAEQLRKAEDLGSRLNVERLALLQKLGAAHTCHGFDFETAEPLEPTEPGVVTVVKPKVHESFCFRQSQLVQLMEQDRHFMYDRLTSERVYFLPFVDLWVVNRGLQRMVAPDSGVLAIMRLGPRDLHSQSDMVNEHRIEDVYEAVPLQDSKFPPLKAITAAGVEFVTYLPQQRGLVREVGHSGEEVARLYHRSPNFNRVMVGDEFSQVRDDVAPKKYWESFLHRVYLYYLYGPYMNPDRAADIKAALPKMPRLSSELGFAPSDIQRLFEWERLFLMEHLPSFNYLAGLTIRMLADELKFAPNRRDALTARFQTLWMPALDQRKLNLARLMPTQSAPTVRDVNYYTGIMEDDPVVMQWIEEYLTRKKFDPIGLTFDASGLNAENFKHQEARIKARIGAYRWLLTDDRFRFMGDRDSMTHYFTGFHETFQRYVANKTEENMRQALLSEAFMLKLGVPVPYWFLMPLLVLNFVRGVAIDPFSLLHSVKRTMNPARGIDMMTWCSYGSCFDLRQ